MLEFVYLFGVQPTMGKVRSEYLGTCSTEPITLVARLFRLSLRPSTRFCGWRTQRKVSIESRLNPVVTVLINRFGINFVEHFVARSFVKLQVHFFETAFMEQRL